MENEKQRSEPYYFLIPYFRKLEKFFATDVQKALEEDEFSFTTAYVLSGIKYYVANKKIIVSEEKYFINNVRSVNKYIWKG